MGLNVCFVSLAVHFQPPRVLRLAVEVSEFMWGVCVENSASPRNVVSAVYAQVLPLLPWTGKVMLALHGFIPYKVQI